CLGSGLRLVLLFTREVARQQQRDRRVNDFPKALAVRPDGLRGTAGQDEYELGQVGCIRLHVQGAKTALKPRMIVRASVHHTKHPSRPSGTTQFRTRTLPSRKKRTTTLRRP